MYDVKVIISSITCMQKNQVVVFINKRRPLKI